MRSLENMYGVYVALQIHREMLLTCSPVLAARIRAAVRIARMLLAFPCAEATGDHWIEEGDDLEDSVYVLVMFDEQAEEQWSQ